MAALPNTWATGNSFTAAAANAVADAVNGLNLSGVYASLPAASFPGRMYFCTDTDAVYRDTGSAWQRVRFGVGGTTHAEPLSSSWSTTTLGSATIAANLDGRLNTCPSAAGDNWRIEYRTLSPTSNYTFTTYLESGLYGSNLCKAAIILRNSTSGNFVSFGHSYDTGSFGGFGVQSIKYSSPTTGIAIYNSQSIAQLPDGLPRWLRVRDNGTTRFLEFSYTGVDWMLHYSVGRTDYVTPDQVGWGTNNSSGQTITARLRSWSVV